MTGIENRLWAADYWLRCTKLLMKAYEQNKPDDLICCLERLIIEIEKYSEDQPRDDHGRWTDGGGDSGSGSSGGGASNGGAGKKKISIENVTGETAVIDKRKFTEYALNPEKQPDKAKAFKDALGYDLSNYQQLEQEIRNTFDREELQQSGELPQGKLYKRVQIMTGPNGKSARVLTSWIDDVNDKNDFHLTSVYVKKE